MKPTGWTVTWGVLASSRNEAAIPVLVSAVDRAPREIAERAMDVLLSRRSPAAYRELLSRWDRLSPQWRDRLSDHGSRFTSAVRDALLSQDETLWRIGCEAVLWIREYDLVAVLLHAVEERDGWIADVACDTIVSLCQMLDDELHDASETKSGRDPQRLKVHALESLERSVQNFERHGRRAVLEGFLLLVDPDNPTLLDILGNPHHHAFLPLIDILNHTTKSTILDLMFAWLQAGMAPLSVLKIVSQRTDMAFVRRLLTTVGAEPSPTITAAMRRVESLAWAQSPVRLLEQLSDSQQSALVRLAAASAMPRQELFQVLKDVLLRGRTGGRRVASELLADFGGSEANALAMQGLDDPDPVVQGNLLRQLRKRAIPGCVTRLVGALESPHEEVRQAARESLSEFTFRRFVTALDMLDDDVRRSMGSLVRRVDLQAIPELLRELKSAARTRRLRAIEAAEAMGVVPDVEAALIDLLGSEEDHLVRAAIVRALGASRSAIAEAALRQALQDRHATVREEAQLALANQPPSDAQETMERMTELIRQADSLLGPAGSAATRQVPGAAAPGDSEVIS